MAWTLLLLWVSMLLLYWIYITIGSKQANTSKLQTLGYGTLLTLGAVCVLLFTTLLAAKIFWLVMIQEFDPTWIFLLLEAIRNNNSGHTAISVGMTL